MDLPMKRFAAVLLAGLAGCAADAVQVVETVPAYCPNPPAIPVNAQGLVLVPAAVRDNQVDWESTFAYRMQFQLASPARLAGKPAVTAQQLAQLEMLANSFQRNIRFQTLPAFGTLSMRQGSEALRQSLGIGPGVSDPQVIEALLKTECALWAGDRARARTTLAQVAQAPDALDLIAPPGGNAPPRIPNATASAAAQAAPAIRLQGGSEGRFFRVGRLGF
jgi:hypothetical protein